MKPGQLFSLASAAILALIPATSHAIGTTAHAQELTIEFVDSENYTDTQTGFGSLERSSAAINEAISASFQEVAKKYLPNGYILSVKVEDIDLAGDRSHMTSTYGDIRVYRDIYPPRIVFTYQLHAPDKQLVARGKTTKSDLAYLRQNTGLRLAPEEEAPFVTELVRGWASKELRRAVAQP